MITFSCGCNGDIDDGIDIIYKTSTRECTKAIGYAFICKKCIDNYETFKTDKEAEEWLLKDGY